MFLGAVNFSSRYSIKWLYPKKFDSNTYSSNILTVCCVLDFDLEYPEKLRELHKNYSLAPLKQKLKKRYFV